MCALLLSVCRYNTSLIQAQVDMIMLERFQVNATSNMKPGQSFLTKVDCVLSPNRVRVFESGIIKLDRNLPNDNRGSKSAESWDVSTNYGSSVGFVLSSISLTEQTTPRSVPAFCPATGNFYQVGTMQGAVCCALICVALDCSYPWPAGPCFCRRHPCPRSCS